MNIWDNTQEALKKHINNKTNKNNIFKSVRRYSKFTKVIYIKIYYSFIQIKLKGVNKWDIPLQRAHIRGWQWTGPCCWRPRSWWCCRTAPWRSAVGPCVPQHRVPPTRKPASHNVHFRGIHPNVKRLERPNGTSVCYYRSTTAITCKEPSVQST